MTKRPSFQWYPGDHRRDTAVQACSLSARGLWREMLDLMHDGQPYGHLTAGGKAIEPDELARIVGVGASKVSQLLRELEDRNVFSRTANGVIYSRRMVRDEYKRQVRGAGGSLSLIHPNVPKPKDGEKDGGKDTFGESFGGSPAVAVGSLQSAQQTTRRERRKAGSFDVLEAGEFVNQIRALAQQRPDGSSAIPRADVGLLGIDVLRAYEAIGGARRFTTATGETHAFLVRDFGLALTSAREQLGENR